MNRTRGVTVVIPTIDREDSLHRAVAAVARAATYVGEPVEAIIVDDSFAPNRVEPAGWDAAGLPVRRVWTADAGLRGPAAARNLGARLANYDLIAFTDDDARCDERWLANGVARLRRDESIAGVEGAVRIDHTSPIDPIRSRIVLNTRGGGYLTASLFVRSDAIQRVGGFRSLRADSDAWTMPYREDTDFGLRVVRNVGQVPFAPEVVVLHPAEQVDIRRLIQLGRYFVVDGAFARLHPDAVPRLWRRPLARLRIRLGVAITLLLPLLGHRRFRLPAIAAIVALGAGVSLQFETELRSAGVRRGTAVSVLDTIRRLPRAVIWSLAAGSARLQGEAMVVFGLATLPDDRDLAEEPGQ